MPTRLIEDESQDELDHIFHILWDFHPNSPFYNNVMNNRNFRRNLENFFVFDVIWMTDDDIKKSFSASDVEARKVRTLWCYLHYLQHKKITFTQFSKYDKMDHYYFMSTPICWSFMKDNLKDWMFH